MDEKIWKTAELAQTYLAGIRGAIPLAQTQIAIMLRLVRAARNSVAHCLDLGCGDGILGQAVLDQYPDAVGLFVDFSEPMLTAARRRLAAYDRASFCLADFGERRWLNSLTNGGREAGVGRSQVLDHFDVVVSGFSIHHLPDERKQSLYKEIFELLVPGGIFLNLEHVASPSRWLEQQFDDYFIDALYAYHKDNNGLQSRAEVAGVYYNRPDKGANMLAPVEEQCHWLRQLGYEQVDCYFKVFELALFGGTKPA